MALTGSAEVRRLGPDRGFLRHLAARGGVLVEALASYRRPTHVRTRGTGTDLGWIAFGAAILAFLGFLAVRDRR
jgi:hypothetical protein